MSSLATDTVSSFVATFEQQPVFASLMLPSSSSQDIVSGTLNQTYDAPVRVMVLPSNKPNLNKNVDIFLYFL